MALRELLVHFGVEVESEKLESFDHRLGEVTEKFKQFGEIFAASLIGEKLHEFVESQVAAGAQLKDMSQRLGVTTDELQQFQLVAQLSGATAEDAATGLRFLNRALGQAAGGGEAADTFKKLGLNVKDLGDESVPLADKVSTIADKFKLLKTHGEKTAFAMKLFGRGGAAMLPMLEEGSEGVKKLFGEFEELGGGMDKDFIAQAKEAEDQSVRLKFAMGGLKSRIAAELIPSILGATQRMTKWVGNIIALSKRTYGLKTAIIALKLGAFAGIIMKIVKVMGLAKGGVWGFIKSLIKFGPIVLLVLALYLIFDDLYTLFKGGDSVIGAFIDELFGVGTAKEVVESVSESFHEFLEWLDSGGSDILREFARGAVMVVVEAFDILLTIGKELGEVFAFVFDTLAGKLTDADKDLDSMGKHWGDFTKHGDKMAVWVRGDKPTLPGTDNEHGTGERIREAQSMSFGADKASGHPRQATSITINNNIQGVSDPEKAGKHAGKATKESLNAAQNRNAFAASRTGK